MVRTSFKQPFVKALHRQFAKNRIVVCFEHLVRTLANILSKLEWFYICIYVESKGMDPRKPLRCLKKGLKQDVLYLPTKKDLLQATDERGI